MGRMPPSPLGGLQRIRTRFWWERRHRNAVDGEDLLILMSTSSDTRYHALGRAGDGVL